MVVARIFTPTCMSLTHLFRDGHVLEHLVAFQVASDMLQHEEVWASNQIITRHSSHLCKQFQAHQVLLYSSPKIGHGQVECHIDRPHR